MKKCTKCGEEIYGTPMCGRLVYSHECDTRVKSDYKTDSEKKMERDRKSRTETTPYNYLVRPFF